MAITGDAFFVSDGFGNGLTQCNANIFHRVVRINLNITISLDLQINQTMSGDLIKHVLKKR